MGPLLAACSGCAKSLPDACCHIWDVSASKRGHPHRCREAARRRWDRIQRASQQKRNPIDLLQLLLSNGITQRSSRPAESPTCFPLNATCFCHCAPHKRCADNASAPSQTSSLGDLHLVVSPRGLLQPRNNLL